MHRRKLRLPAGASGRGLSLDELDTLGAAEAAGSAESEEDGMRDDETASDSAFASSELWDLVADNPEALSDADFEGVSRDMRTLASPADMLGDMAVSGGALAMVVSLVTALFLAQDFSMRFVRNLVMDRRGRVRYYGEKLVLVGFLAVFYLVVAALAGAASFAAAGFTYAAASPLGDLALFLGLAWLLPSPTGARRRSSCGRPAAPGPGWPGRSWSAPASPGSLLGQVLLLLGRGVPWIGALEPWTLASCMQNVGNHASTLLATPAAAPLTMAPLAVQVLIVGGVAVALCAALTFGPLRKRDL